MNVSYKRDMNHNYLVLEPDIQMEDSEYQVRMLAANDIPGLLKCNIKKIDGQVYFYYEVTSKQSLERVFERDTIGSEDIVNILQGIQISMKNMCEYLLEPQGVVLDPKYIYMDVESQKPFLCYLPSYNNDFSESFHTLTEYILMRLDHKDNTAVVLGYDIYRQTLQDNYNLEQILESVYLLKKQVYGKEADTSEENNKNINANAMSPFVDITEEQAEAGLQERDKSFQRNPQKILEREEIKSKAGKDRSQEVTIKKKYTGKTKQHKRKSIHIVSCKKLILLLSAFAGMGILLAVSWYWRLDLTQTGGVLFLFLGILCYLFSVIWKKEDESSKKNDSKDLHSQWIDEIQDTSNNSGLDSEILKENKIGGRKEEICGMTTLLCENENKQELCLISMEPHIRGNITLGDKDLVIGKLKSKTDVTVDLASVSRIHAKLWKENNTYYVMDLNSTNGTFLNGEHLEPNEKREIKPSDEISFADASYYIGK